MRTALNFYSNAANIFAKAIFTVAIFAAMIHSQGQVANAQTESPATSAPAKPKPTVTTPPAPTPTTDQEKTLWDKTKENSGKAWDKTKELSADAYEKSKEQALKLQDSINRTRLYRDERNISFAGTYGYLDFWSLGKYGITGAYQSADTSWDFDYQHGSIGLGAVADIASVSEDRIHLLRRSYGERGTFNWYGGLFYSKFQAELGDELLSEITNEPGLHYDVVEVQTAGVTFGIGNRWQRRNGFTFGADWIEVNWPLITIKEDADVLLTDADEDDKDDIQDAIDVIKDYPAFAFLKLYVGYSF